MRAKSEEGGDAVYEDDKAAMLILAISLIRISSMCLGTVKTHYAAVVWQGLARQMLDTHGSAYPEGSPIAMDLKPKHAESNDADTLAEIPSEAFKSFMSEE